MEIKYQFLLLFLGMILTGELVARFYLGLGTPPLSVIHPEIEYMYQPNQDVKRFGNRFVVNQYGMRSDPFATKKPSEQIRVMMFGDSVINGGNQTDHEELATTIIQHELEAETGSDVVVGNISAGSWGPGNWLAYEKAYGFFDADIVVLVLSSHDYNDNPTFTPLDENTHPVKKPFSALAEGVTRYLPRYLPLSLSKGTDLPQVANAASGHIADSSKALQDLSRFLEQAKEQVPAVFVFQHWELAEIQEEAASSGYQYIKDICTQLGIVPTSLGPSFTASIRSGSNPYRDNIHPNSTGQQLIARSVLHTILNNDVLKTLHSE